MSSSPDPRAVIHRLYRDQYGYKLSEADKQRVLATRSSPTYGEILPHATTELAQELKLGPDDTFYDLGSGLGKVVLQLAMSVPLAGCFGLELVRNRHRIASNMLARVREQGLLLAAACEFHRANFMSAPLDDATVVYTCSTAFSAEFMNELAAHLARLPVGLRWVSTRGVQPNPWFEVETALWLDMSWRRATKVQVHRLHTQHR